MLLLIREGMKQNREKYKKQHTLGDLGNHPLCRAETRKDKNEKREQNN